MPDHADFLRAICEQPDDDTPRLAYADWLEETGTDADRATRALAMQHVRCRRVRRAEPRERHEQTQERNPDERLHRVSCN